jgi:hypothetical protein
MVAKRAAMPPVLSATRASGATSDVQQTCSRDRETGSSSPFGSKAKEALSRGRKKSPGRSSGWNGLHSWFGSSPPHALIPGVRWSSPGLTEFRYWIPVSPEQGEQDGKAGLSTGVPAESSRPDRGWPQGHRRRSRSGDGNDSLQWPHRAGADSSHRCNTAAVTRANRSPLLNLGASDLGDGGIGVCRPSPGGRGKSQRAAIEDVATALPGDQRLQ